MKHACWILAMLMAALYVAGAESPAASQDPVTWSHQIAPLVFNNCTTCHHPGGGGPLQPADL